VLVDEVLASITGVIEPVVIDLCTGSGAVAISVAYERPDARVFATEIVATTAEVARENAQRCGVADRVIVFEGDLFQPLPTHLRSNVHVVVSNPPYIPTADLAALPAEVGGFEPGVALDGGSDGLVVARRIIEDALGWLLPGGALFVETDTTRAQEAVNAMAAWYEGTRVVRDLSGRDRVATGRKRKD
jgi:release factor glutamine methyltransferase